MRIHRIRLRDYRGIDLVDLRLADRGVTIVEGPNEIGKSSIAEAIGLVFDTPDSSASARVRALQPVHRDVGTEVTVEVSTGPYRFVLTKVWNRARRTELDVLAPERRQLRGREAHDEVQRMLDETLDRPLWDALRVLQGAAPGAVRFGELVSLGHVLDVAAGAELAGEREGDLWTRIRSERDRYWTPTGQPKVERGHLVAVLDAAGAQVSAIEVELAELAAAVTDVDLATAEIAQLDASLPERVRHVAELEAQLEVVHAQQGELRVLEVEEDAARSAFDTASTDLARRRAAVTELEALAAAAATERDALAARIPVLEHVCGLEASHRARQDAARTALAAAEATGAVRHADLTYRRQEIEIGQLTERRDRVVAARQALADVELELAGARVDERLVAELEAAELEAARTEAAARVTGATVTLRAVRTVEVAVDEETRHLDAGSDVELVVGGRTTVRVADVEVVVDAGLDARTLADDAGRAAALLAKLCADGGVASLAEARRQAERRVTAIRARDDAERQVRDNLRDLTFEQISAKVDGHAARLAGYLDARPAEPPLADSYEHAKVLAAEADRDLAAARAVLAAVDADVDSAVAAARDAQVERATRSRSVEHTSAAHRSAAEALDASRALRSDDTLASAVGAARRRLDDATAARALAARRLAEREPESLDALLDNARRALERAHARRDEVAERRRDRQALLTAKGELGLQEQLDAARTTIERTGRELARWDARAAAARRLHQAFDDARARARQRYLTPFRTRIEQLARIVFGADVEISLDDDLRPATRTLGGVTLPVEQLSGGAREQLDLISRLACAGIVSAEGGAPVVVDDALGWSDPGRLDAMGATIGLAARDCQVVVLTCSPDRFAGIGAARVVRFDDLAGDLAGVRSAGGSAAGSADVSEGQALEPRGGEPEVAIDLDAIGADRAVEPAPLVHQGDQLPDRAP